MIKPRHRLQGAGFGAVPPHWRGDLMDEAVAVSDDEAQLMRSRLAKEEGLHVGYTAAANVVAALSVAASLPQDTIVATILCDTGMKYED